MNQRTAYRHYNRGDATALTLERIKKLEMLRFENMYSYMREPVETMKRFKANGTFKNILNPSPVFYQNQQPQVQSKGLDIIRQPNNSIMFEHS